MYIPRTQNFAENLRAYNKALQFFVDCQCYLRFQTERYLNFEDSFKKMRRCKNNKITHKKIMRY